MGWKYRRPSIKIGKHTRLNLNKNGMSVTHRGKWSTQTTNLATGKTRTTVKTPIKGLSYTTTSGGKAKTRRTESKSATHIQAQPAKTYSPKTYRVCGTFALVVGILCALFGILLFSDGGKIFILFGAFLIWAGMAYRKKASDILVQESESDDIESITQESDDDLPADLCDDAAVGAEDVSASDAADNTTTPDDSEPANAEHSPITPEKESENAVAITHEKPVIQLQQESFDKVLDALPMAIVRTDGKKEDVEITISDDLKYSNITTRTNYDKLGNFVVVDTETTGISASKNKIVEVSAIKFDGFEPVEAFSTLVNPGRKIPASASAINHISDAMVANAPAIWQIMPSLNDFIGGLPIVGHNLPFDLDFLCRAGLKIGDKQRLFDTLQLARRTIKKEKQVWDKDLGCYIGDGDPFSEVPDYKLQTLCRYYLICAHCDHRATGDALATGYLFRELAQERTGQN